MFPRFPGQSNRRIPRAGPHPHAALRHLTQAHRPSVEQPRHLDAEQRVERPAAPPPEIRRRVVIDLPPPRSRRRASHASIRRTISRAPDTPSSIAYNNSDNGMSGPTDPALSPAPRMVAPRLWAFAHAHTSRARASSCSSDSGSLAKNSRRMTFEEAPPARPLTPGPDSDKSTPD